MLHGHRLKRSAVRGAIVGLLATLIAACGTTDQTTAPAAQQLPEVADSDDVVEIGLVVVTTSILGDIVRVLVGEDANVKILMPAGIDPHAYQPQLPMEPCYDVQTSSSRMGCNWKQA